MDLRSLSHPESSEVVPEVHWPDDVIQELREYEIDEGNSFRRLPTLTKMKAQGNDEIMSVCHPLTLLCFVCSCKMVQSVFPGG